MRPRYPGQGKSGAERELLVSLTQVFERNHSESSTVNVLGERSLQCLWEGHSCSEHLLRKSNCIWYWNLTFFGATALVLDLKFSHTFSHSSFSEFERSQRMTWLDFISNLGGVCGLCLGISFISITELVYWFTFRLFKRVLGAANWFEMLRKTLLAWNMILSSPSLFNIFCMQISLIERFAYKKYKFTFMDRQDICLLSFTVPAHPIQ